MFMDLIHNLSVLIAMSIISGLIINKHSNTWLRTISLGFLFGFAALIAMSNPFVFAKGLIFDGRSVMISLCAFFFGPVSGLITVLMTVPMRLYQGGDGAIVGSMVIVSSALIGYLFNHHIMRKQKQITIFTLYSLGICVHLAMLLLMFFLPNNKGLEVLKQISVPVLLFYPLTTLVIGKILLIQQTNQDFLHQINEQEKRFRLVFENSIDPIFWTDVETMRIIRCNQSALDLFEMKEEDLINQHFSILHPPDLFNEVEKKFDLSVHNKQQYSIEVPIITKTGIIKWVEVASTLIDIDHHLINQGVFRDITERKKWTEALQISETRFRSLFESVSLIGVILDKHGLIRYCNDFLLSVSGWERNEILNKNWFEIFIEDATNSELYKKVFFDTITTGVFPKHYTNEIIIKNQSKRLVEWNNIILYDNDGDIDGICSIGIDITEAKEKEKLLLDQQNQLKKSNEELLKFNLAATGRELKMIELKLQINELSKKLNMPEPYNLDFLEKSDVKTLSSQIDRSSGLEDK